MGGDGQVQRGYRALAAAILLGAGVAVAGCGSGGSAGAAGSPRAAAGSPPVAAQLKTLAADYLAISGKANDQLDREVAAYAADEHGNLAAARADLRAEVATERWWDEQLLRIAFPPALESIARAVVQVNQRRIALTERQAGAGTLKAMTALDAQHRSADAELEFAVGVIRRQLGLPPPQPS